MTISSIKKNTRKQQKQQQTHNKRSILRGGKKLGEGSFGCVIVPNIKCAASKIKYNTKIKTVSKLVGFKNKEDLKDLNDEIRLNTLIKSFDKDNKYFITILEHCKINTNEKDSFESRDNISVQNYDYNVDKYNKCVLNKNRLNYNLIMPFAGLDLIDIIIEPKYADKLVIIKNKLQYVIYHLLKGIRYLHKHNIIHLDIKPENIAIDISKEGVITQCAFIDFGLAYDIKHSGKADDLFYFLSGTPGYIPPESYILYLLYSYGIKKIGDAHFKESMLKKATSELADTEMYYKEELSLPQTIFKHDKTHDNSFFSFLKTDASKYFKNNDLNHIYDIFADLIKRDKIIIEYFKPMDGIIFKQDIYALGITLYLMYKMTNSNNPHLLDLISNMIEIDPIKRYNINDCFKHPYIKSVSSKKLKKQNRDTK